jgi:hypothetical protein
MASKSNGKTAAKATSERTSGDLSAADRKQLDALAAAAKAATDSLQRRNDCIVRLRERGVPVPVIAEAAGMSAAGTRRVFTLAGAQ